MFTNINTSLEKYNKIESGLNSEYKKILLALFLDNRFNTQIDFEKFSHETIPLLTLPETFNIETFLKVNGQKFYSAFESLLKTETQKLLLHQMFGGDHLISVDWDKCSAEILPYYIIDIYGEYLNWDILIKHNEISPDILQKYEHLFLNVITDDDYTFS
jgi:hypothetical protein